MKNEKSVNYKHIGNVLYRKNSRAKNISIRINSKGEVKVTVPAWCTYHRAEQFVLDKEGWIINKTLKIQRSIKEKLAWDVGDIVHILNGQITISQGKKSVFEGMQVDNDYIVELPTGYDSKKEVDRENLFFVLADIGLWEAKQCLPSILQDLSRQHNLKYKRLSVRRMRTRWGSCSSTNSISLNSGLVFLPMELIVYVCVHELVHTIHKNHSANFWNALIAILPDALVLRKRLQKHGIIA